MILQAAEATMSLTEKFWAFNKKGYFYSDILNYFMKKIIAIFGICSLIFACTSGKKSEGTEDTITVAAPAETVPGVAATGISLKGEQLISSSDCLTCHKVDAKIVGPAYADVAKKNHYGWIRILGRNSNGTASS